MELRVVFTKNEKSLISRAIMWFSQRRHHPERRCSHVFIKFDPEGLFEKQWLVFEAMERGCWLNLYERSLGKQTVVAEFIVKCPGAIARTATQVSLYRSLDWYYDYVGIGIWAWWILMEKWFATPMRWFNATFRPGKAAKALFCSGLVWQVLSVVQSMWPSVDYKMKGMTARSTTPVDLCNILSEALQAYDKVPQVELKKP